MKSLLLALLVSSTAFAEDPPARPSGLSAGLDDQGLHITFTGEASAEGAPPVSDVDALRHEMEAQRQQLDAMRQELDALRQRPVLPVPPVPPAPVALPDASQAVVVSSDEALDDDLSVMGQDVVVRGTVDGDVHVVGGDILVDNGGVIDGDAVSVGGRVIVHPGGEVHGDRIQLDYDDLSTLAGSPSTSFLSALYHRLIFLLAFGGAGVLLVGLVPERIGRIARAIETRPFQTSLVGAIATVLVGLAGVAFAITIIGIPVTLLLAGMMALAWMLGFVGLCQALGDRLPFRQKVHGRWLAFLVGSAVVCCVGLLPWVGWVVVAVASVVGVGAAFTTRFGSR